VPVIVFGIFILSAESERHEVCRGLNHRHGHGGFTNHSRGNVGFTVGPYHRGIRHVARAIVRCVVNVVSTTRTLDLIVGHGPEV
jgi:predicted acetyltransferase